MTPFPEDADGFIPEPECTPQESNTGTKWCYGRTVLTSSCIEKYSVVYEMFGDEFKAEIVDNDTFRRKYGFMRTGKRRRSFQV